MFETGAAGEVTVAGIMDALTPEGYHVLHDRCLPGSAANIDHVLIGPAGVFVVDTKNWSGELAIEGNILRQNGRRRDRHVELVRDQAVEIAMMLDELSISRAVRPVICFVGSAAVTERILLERVHLLTAEMLLPSVSAACRVGSWKGETTGVVQYPPGFVPQYQTFTVYSPNTLNVTSCP